MQHDGPSRLGHGFGVYWDLQYGSSHRQPENISIDDSPEHHHIPDVKQAHAMLESASLCFARSKPKQKSCYLTGMKGIKGIGQKLFSRG